MVRVERFENELFGRGNEKVKNIEDDSMGENRKDLLDREVICEEN